MVNLSTRAVVALFSRPCRWVCVEASPGRSPKLAAFVALACPLDMLSRYCAPLLTLTRGAEDAAARGSLCGTACCRGRAHCARPTLSLGRRARPWHSFSRGPAQTLHRSCFCLRWNEAQRWKAPPDSSTDQYSGSAGQAKWFRRVWPL